MRKADSKYWELILEAIREAIANRRQAFEREFSLSISLHIKAAHLLYYGGVRWCDTATKCFNALIDILSSQKASMHYNTAEELDWLIRTIENKSLVSLQQLSIWRIRKSLGMDLSLKVKELDGLLPPSISDSITMKFLTGELFDIFLDGNFNGENTNQLRDESLIFALFILLDCPSSIFRRFRLQNGKEFTILEIMTLQVPEEYLETLKRLLEDAKNPGSMADDLLAALNCSIRRKCPSVLRCLLEKVLQNCGPVLPAGRSPFTVRPHFSLFSPRLQAALNEPPENICSCSPLVVAFLDDSIQPLEMLRDSKIAFDLAKVYVVFSFLDMEYRHRGSIPNFSGALIRGVDPQEVGVWAFSDAGYGFKD